MRQCRPHLDFSPRFVLDSCTFGNFILCMFFHLLMLDAASPPFVDLLELFNSLDVSTFPHFLILEFTTWFLVRVREYPAIHQEDGDCSRCIHKIEFMPQCEDRTGLSGQWLSDPNKVSPTKIIPCFYCIIILVQSVGTSLDTVGTLWIDLVSQCSCSDFIA